MIDVLDSPFFGGGGSDFDERGCAFGGTNGAYLYRPGCCALRDRADVLLTCWWAEQTKPLANR